MIGVNLKIKKNKIIKKNFYNNNSKVLIFKYPKNEIFVIGDIFESQKSIKNTINLCFKQNSFKDLLKLNGEYFFLIIQKLKKKIICINSKNSYIPIFYNYNKKVLNIKSNILDFENHFFKKINKKKIEEWLLFNGRSFDNKTFLKEIKILEPGQIISIKENKVTTFNSPSFCYQNNNISIQNNILLIKRNLKRAINQRIENVNKKISFALSGGLDSRILLSLVSKKNKNKIITHTYGDKNNFESIIAKKISKKLGFKHRFYEIKRNDYYKYAESSVINGSFSSIFKNGVKTKYSKIIKKQDRSKYFMMGNALDVLIASSFSKKDIKKVNNLNQYINWYKKNYLLFNFSEIKKIFNKDTQIQDKDVTNVLKKFVRKIKHKNDFINLNDAITFETRIKRWHNYSLAEQSRISNFLIPTYDKYFLHSCSKINSSYRFNDKFRRKLIFNINPNLAKIPTSNEMEKSKINSKSEKKFYDTNLGLDMKKNKRFKEFYLEIKKKINNSIFSKKINFKYVDYILDEHIRDRKDNTRKIFMLLTLFIILTEISKKNA